MLNIVVIVRNDDQYRIIKLNVSLYIKVKHVNMPECTEYSKLLNSLIGPYCFTMNHREGVHCDQTIKSIANALRGNHKKYSFF